MSDIAEGARALHEELAEAGFTLADVPLAIAHRAGNHLELLEEATAYGADVIEADVYYHRGRLEVRHLKTLGPVPVLWDRWVIAPGWHRRFGLQELVQGVLDFGFAGQLMLDMKGNDMRLADSLARAMDREAPGMRYAVCSRLWGLVDPFLSLDHVEVYHSIGTRAEWLAMDAHLARCGADRTFSINGNLLDEGIAGWLREHGGFAISWHINTRSDLKRAMALGIRGVTSDNVPMLREIARLRSIARQRGVGASDQALVEVGD